MEQQNKDIIKALASQTFADNKPFGQSMASLMFQKGKRALLFIDGQYILLLTQKADATKDIKTLVELMSHLRYMEDEHIIYVQNTEVSDDHILYEGCDDMKKTSAIQGYDLGSDCFLKSEQGEYFIESSDGTKLLQQNVNIDFLANEIKSFLESRIFPTAAVNQLISHNYLSENDYNNHQALKFSRRSVWVAIIIACLSPIITLLLSNKWGTTTIKEVQFTTINERIGVANNTIDTVSATIQNIDNSLKKLIENEQDTIKPLQGQ